MPFILADPELIGVESIVGNHPALDAYAVSQCAPVKFIKRHQLPNMLSYERQAHRMVVREKAASHSLYEYTACFSHRLTEWDSRALKLLKELTGWKEPLGISYSKHRKITTAVILGDPELVAKIVIRFYETAVSPEPVSQTPLISLESEDPVLWKAEIHGDWEGKWYDFQYTSQRGVVTAKGKPIPETYTVVDPTAHKVVYERAQVWYPPCPADRPAFPSTKPRVREPAIALEIELSDMSPPDGADIVAGTADAFTQSALLREMVAPFTVIELMPVRVAKYYDAVSSDSTKNFNMRDVFYTRYWGYMPRSWAISCGKGGPDGLMKLIDMFHQQGIRVRKDEVLQHLANPADTMDDLLSIFHYALPDTFRKFDYTGCGNTTNMLPDATFTKLAIQMTLRDLLIYGFDGHRQDLMGAIPRETAELLVSINHSLGADFCGEPYGWGGAEWDRFNDPPRLAALWDPDFRGNVRHLAKYGGNWERLISSLSGGHPSSWVRNANDRTAMLDVHDGETLAHYLDTDYHKMAHAHTMLLSALGDVLMFATQLVGYRHPYLDDTPVNLFTLTREQQAFRTFALSAVAVRKKYNSYFAYPWLEENDYIRFVRTDNPQAIGVYLQRPAIGHQKEKLLMLFNLSEKHTEFSIPEGKWHSIIDTASLRAVLEGSIYPPAEKCRYEVPPFSTVWLVGHK